MRTRFDKTRSVLDARALASAPGGRGAEGDESIPLPQPEKTGPRKGAHFLCGGGWDENPVRQNAQRFGRTSPGECARRVRQGCKAARRN
jgi:hypothetical protein